MKVFVSIPNKSGFLSADVRKYLEERFEVVYSPYDTEQVNEAEFQELAKDAEIVLTGWRHPFINEELLKGTSIRLIAHTGGTVGNLVGQDVYDKGIKVISGNLLYAESVAEGTIAYMLLGLRRLPDYINRVKEGGWKPPSAWSEGLLNQTVGIVGLGTISKIVIKMLQTFKVRIKIYSSHSIDEQFLKENNAEQASMDEIFKSCKIVSIHSALNQETEGMIGKKQFDLLQDGALFLNTARGKVIKEDEMIEALKEKRFRAVLDVYCKEPLDLDSELRKLDNVYCVPHMGGPTLDRYPMITKGIIDNLVYFQQGESMELEIAKEVAARMTVE